MITTTTNDHRRPQTTSKGPHTTNRQSQTINKLTVTTRKQSQTATTPAYQTKNAMFRFLFKHVVITRNTLFHSLQCQISGWGFEIVWWGPEKVSSINTWEEGCSLL